MSMRRRGVMILVSALAAAGLGWLARAPYDPPGADDGLLRLSWRLRGEKVETCRPRTQAELDATPVHMRTPDVCESLLLAYVLTVQIDDAAPDSTHIRPGGARGDRPVFVLRELPLTPGRHRVRVRFMRVAPDDAPPAGMPASHPLETDAVVVASPGEIHLITLASDASRLVHISSDSR